MTIDKPGGRVAHRRLGFWRRFAASLVRPLMTILARPDWRGMANLPATGGVIVAANHISHADPFALAHYVFKAGRWPRYLAKESVFRIPVLGYIVGAVGQIPVARGTVDARKALDQAVAAVEAGKCVLIYPEGTTTKEPDLWPMRGKTGVARLWLATRAPVVPIAMWGPERLFDPRTKRLRLVPRTPVTVVAGPPLDLSRWADATPNATSLAEITEFIMLSLRDMVAEIRGGTPPPLWSRPAPGSGQPSSGETSAESEG